MLLDDGQVDAIDSEFLERLSLGFHAAPDLTAWRSTLGLLGKRTSLSEVLEALHVGLDAPSSPLHVLETLLANSGHSNDLVRDLLPLHRAAVEAHLSRALLATVGSRLRTAGVWTVTLSRVMNFLFCAGWTERPVSLAHSVRLTPAQSAALDRWLDLTMHFLATAEADYCLDALRGQLGNLRMGYAGQTCGRAQELVADQVIPAWPIAEHTGLLDITRFLDGELLSDLACPARCLKPVSEWQTHPPKGVGMASDGEWYKLAVVGIERGLFAVIDERDIMRDMDGALILNGAMGVKKLKEHADGTVTQLQRFITNLVPMNSYLRRLRGDSGLLPSVGRLGLIQLEADETLEIDSEDMVSAFNLFRMPVPWRGAFTYAKQVPASVCPGGDPNTMVYLAITTVPMGWVGAVDVIQHVARNIVFKLARVPSTTEVRPRGLFPDHGPYSLVCMDGIDIVSRVRQAGTRRDGTSATRRGENCLAERFQEVCAEMGLPLHAVKRLVGAASGTILGSRSRR